MARTPTPSPKSCVRAACSSGNEAGFSFMEIVVVMGAMAMLSALAIGFLGNVGKGTYIAQAKGMLSETVYRCLNGSIGGRRAELTLRVTEDEEGVSRLRIGAIVARPVLTHQFETLEFASGGNTPGVNGQVEIAQGKGRTGNAGLFKGGYLEFPAQSRFAMTEGLELDVWVKPQARQRIMSLTRAGESYEVALVQRGDSDSYDVRLTLKLRKASDSMRITALTTTFETSGGTGGPVVADGRWNRVQVSFHGLEPSIRVNGLESYAAKGSATGGRDAPGGALGSSELEAVQRIAVPGDGTLPLTIGSGERPYHGEMDCFRLLGVFRSEELERDLPGTLEVIYPALPMRIAFANGALDPDVHNSDLIVRIIDTSTPDDPALRLTIGMYGKVAAFFEKPGEGGPDARNPRLAGKKRGRSAEKTGE
jgi:hypothetical protein